MSTNPFDRNYQGQLVAQALTPKGRAAANASAVASAKREALRNSSDPVKRVIGSGAIPGMGLSRASDSGKAGRITKPGGLG